MEPKQLGEYVKSVTDALAPLGANIEAAGKQLFTYAIRQVYANAIENFICLGVAGVAVYGMTRLYAKFVENDPDFDNPAIWIPFTIASTGLGIFTTAALICAMSSIHSLIAPEWSAVTLVIQTLHPAK